MKICSTEYFTQGAADDLVKLLTTTINGAVGKPVSWASSYTRDIIDKTKPEDTDQQLEAGRVCRITFIMETGRD